MDIGVDVVGLIIAALSLVFYVGKTANLLTSLERRFVALDQKIRDCQEEMHRCQLRAAACRRELCDTANNQEAKT